MLSVVIPAHNAARWIVEAIASVKAQSFSPPPDIIVVTSNCTDNTADLARAAGARVIDSPAPGPAAARNAGVAASSGEFIAFLDADDLWPPNSLASRVSLLNDKTDAAMVFGDCRQFDDIDGKYVLRPETLFAESGLDAHFFGDTAYVTAPLDKLLDAGFVTTGAVVMRRHAFDALGGFDESLQHVEDLDLWLRAAARFPLLWHPDLALLRRRHDANLSHDTPSMQIAYIRVLTRLAKTLPAGHLTVRIRALRQREHRALARQALTSGHPLRAMKHCWLAVTR
ncbi:MAG: glycosyltransferase family A protein [Methyloversatilis sp.]|uniref:glycosyltransferase family 2 protein n=1 Tax=Methyloversatilis sp. TaxID=2569862 RepID=UPI002735559C|nr:glycosyltransferase family A protein [Methyloversatilis sp.]MDP3872665.1 glycosyltransferase family A protein [Methyloversatilis sp.]